MPLIRCGDVGFYFCHIPRTAGRAFIQAMRLSGCSVDYSAPRGSHSHSFYKEWSFKFKGYPSVAVVRDPISRFVSAMSFEDRVKDEVDLYQQVRLLRRLPITEQRHFEPQVGFIGEETRLYTFENGLGTLESELRAFGFIKSSVPVERFNPGGKDLNVTPTDKRIHLEKMKRFYRQDIVLHVKATEAEKLRGVQDSLK